MYCTVQPGQKNAGTEDETREVDIGPLTKSVIPSPRSSSAY